jgi:hypothetical protein
LKSKKADNHSIRSPFPPALAPEIGDVATAMIDPLRPLELASIGRQRMLVMGDDMNRV